MNWEHLKKLVGSSVRLRPLPIRIAPNGKRLRSLDDKWFLTEVNRKTGLELINTATGHVLKLKGDNVKEFRSPDYLLLRCRLFIHGPNIELEPV